MYVRTYMRSAYVRMIVCVYGRNSQLTQVLQLTHVHFIRVGCCPAATGPHHWSYLFSLWRGPNVLAMLPPAKRRELTSRTAHGNTSLSVWVTCVSLCQNIKNKTNTYVCIFIMGKNKRICIYSCLWVDIIAYSAGKGVSCCSDLFG